MEAGSNGNGTVANPAPDLSEAIAGGPSRPIRYELWAMPSEGAQGGLAMKVTPVAAPPPALVAAPATAPAGQRLRLEETIKDVLNIRTGAFGPFSQNPVLRGILIPFGSIGAVQLADALIRLLR
jgi:hypothetical protein